MCIQWNKASCLTVLTTYSGIHWVSIEILFFDPHSLKNLITRFACYYSLRSYSQLASLVIRFLSLWGSKNEISLSTKWIPLFVANTVKQKPISNVAYLSMSLHFTWNWGNFSLNGISMFHSYQVQTKRSEKIRRNSLLI